MRTIGASFIGDKIARLAVKANTNLRNDVLFLLKKALKVERNRLARDALAAIIKNAHLASKKNLAVCQDTGMPVVFVELGSKVSIQGNLSEIIGRAVREGYKSGYLRASIQKDPIWRKAKLSYEPSIVHIDIVRGSKVKITILPKGFGSENTSTVKMFRPTASLRDIEDFILESVRAAGANACPPYIIGVGIGGTQDFACLLAKKALLRPLTRPHKNTKIAGLEKRLLKKINAFGIGPLGFGGRTTALAVTMQTYPTHIAGLPVAINISCHALRSGSITI